jgi:hypothetical protein
MPYSIIHHSDGRAKPWCVVKKADGTEVACHESEQQAKDQITAIGIHEHAQFDAEMPANGDVIRPALLFKAGDYPDKSFAMTAEELAAVPASFVPVQLDLEHMPTVLDGRLGQVESVHSPDGGQTLMGHVRLASWLAKALGDAPVKLSCAWDRATKRLQKVSLVRNPRICDAELLAAFYDPEQPRDDTGKWTGGAGGSTASGSSSRSPEGHENLPAHMVNPHDGGPGPSIQYHGSPKALKEFNTSDTYMLGTPNEAVGYAHRLHDPGTPVKSGYVHMVRRNPGPTRNIDAAIEREMESGTFDQGFIDAQAEKARNDGFRYIHFEHPSFFSDEDQQVVVSLYPKEDLKIVGKMKAKTERGVSFSGMAGWLCERVAAFSDSESASCAWDRATKRLQKVSLVRNPRIDDAQLLAAFASGGGETGLRWVTINGHAVPLQDKEIGGGHVNEAAAKHGLSNTAHRMLVNAHKAGHIATTGQLFGAVAHAKRLQEGGLQESLAYRTAIDTQKAATAGRAKNAPTGVVSMKPSELHADPERFQYKVMVGEKGVNGELQGVKKWNENLAGVVLAWKDPKDGKSYVVNGHHRLDLAQRLGAPSLDVRHLDVPDAQTARYIGAVANIAEGRGTAVDAAKLLRDSHVTPEQLAEDGVSLKGKMARDGVALSGLPDHLWGQVFRGEIPVSRGVAIGGSGLDHTQQTALAELVNRQEGKGKRLSDKDVSELASYVSDAGGSTSSQQTLWGDEEVTQSHAVEKAQLSSWLKGTIAKDKKLFGFVAKGQRAQELGRAGNVINVSESQRVADQAAQMEEVFHRLAHRTGPVADALNEAAGKVARGGSTDAVRSELYERVRGAVHAALTGTTESRAPGAEEAPRYEDTHSGSLFSRGEGAGQGVKPSGIASWLWARMHRST